MVGGRWTCLFPRWSFVNSCTCFYLNLEVFLLFLLLFFFFFFFFWPVLSLPWGMLACSKELQMRNFRDPLGPTGRNYPNQRAGPDGLLNSSLEPAASPALPTIIFLSLLGICVKFISFFIQANLLLVQNFICTLNKSCLVAAARSFPRFQKSLRFSC